MRRLRVLLTTLETMVPPETIEGLTDAEIAPFKTDYDVLVTLEELGHEVEVVGLGDSLDPLREAIGRFRPHIVFNLLEEFGGSERNVPYVIGWLRLVRQAYTGCNPVGMMISYDKALQRKILRFHRVNVPDFMIVPRGRAPRRPARLGFPLIVKALTRHGSIGISQASIVHDDAKLAERVRYMHDTAEDDVIVEQYIAGREIYLGLIGNRRVEAFPIWELQFENLPEGAPNIATEKVKWDLRYQKRSGVRTAVADDLPPALAERIVRTCRRAYRRLEQSGYCRMDMRLTDDGRIYVIESNPNPQLSFGEDFAESAEQAGLKYPDLIGRILSLGLRWKRAW